MPNRILTSHAGSLPRPENLISLNQRRAEAEEATGERAYQEALRAAVTDVVKRQRDTGIDLVNDGEYGHSMGMVGSRGLTSSGSGSRSCRRPRRRRMAGARRAVPRCSLAPSRSGLRR